MTNPNQAAPDPPKQVRCWRCEDPATREFCEPAEPWVPYCPKHPNHNGTAGDRKLIVHPKPDALFTAWVWRKEGDPK